MNLFGMIGNDAINRRDYLGLLCEVNLIFGHTLEAMSAALSGILESKAKEKTTTLGNGPSDTPPTKDESYGDMYGCASCFGEAPSNLIQTQLGADKAIFDPGELTQFLEVHRTNEKLKLLGKVYLYEEGMRGAFKFMVERAIEKAKDRTCKGFNSEGSCCTIRVQIKCIPRQPNDSIAAADVLTYLCGKTLELEISKIKAGKGYPDIDWDGLRNGAGTAKFK